MLKIVDYLNKLEVNTQVIAIYMGGSNNCEIFNMNIENCGGPIYPSGASQITIGVSDDKNGDKNYIHDCIFNAIYDSFNIRIFTPFTEVSTYHAMNNVVERCKFKYAEKSCVEIAGLTTHDNIVKDCEVMDCGTEAMDIDKTSYNNTIRNVVVHNCSGSTEIPGYVPFGGISIQHRNSSDAVSGYYSHNNIVENCIIENTVGCGFYTNTQDFKFINCVCKNALVGMTLSMSDYPTNRLPKGEILNCELHGSNQGIQFDSPGDVIIDKCKIYGKTGIRAIGYTQYGTEDIIKVNNSEIHHGNKGIQTQVQNMDITNNIFYDDITPFDTSNCGGIFASNFTKLNINNNFFNHTTARNINITCRSTDNPSKLLTLTNNFVTNVDSPAMNITGGQLSVGNFVGNSRSPYLNSNLVIDKTYGID